VEERLEVWFSAYTPDADMRAVQGVFRSEGIEVETRTREPTGVGNGLGFHVALYVVGTSISAFLAGYFGAAGTDAWRKTKALLGRLRQFHGERYPQEAPPGVEVELELEVADESGTHVFMRSGASDEAFRKLLELEEFEPHKWYVWDGDRGEWAEREPGGLGWTPAPHSASGLRERLRRLFRR
jgi:hypothetical protein